MMPLSERRRLVKHPAAHKLLDIMLKKHTNLCVSADVTSSAELVLLIEQVGPYVCMIKTHIDIITDFSSDLIIKLQELSNKFNFVIFEDRKFADIGSTVQKQFSGGMYKISSWAHFVNAHIVVGHGIIRGLQIVSNGQSLLLIAQMSAAGNLCNEGYTASAVNMALDHEDFVSGFICTESITEHRQFLNFVPGVNISSDGDSLGQQYVTPLEAVKKGADVIIVGRGIYMADDPAEAAKMYRDACFSAYISHLNGQLP